MARNPVFSYLVLRLLLGAIAVLLPVVVCVLSSAPLPSISASYHTEGRNAFVGLLCVVAAFLAAYNGRSLPEAVLRREDTFERTSVRGRVVKVDGPALIRRIPGPACSTAYTSTDSLALIALEMASSRPLGKV